MTISLLIDAVLLALLAAALIYAVMLSRRIARLQSALLELAPALQAFCDAVSQSERSVEEIRRETDRLQEEARRMPSAEASRQASRRAAGTAAPDTGLLRATPDRSELVRNFFEAARMRTQ